MAKKIIVTVAPTSNFHGKEANPALPEQPKEVAEAAYECYNAGASIVHIHSRDKQGIPTNDVNVIRETCEMVKAKCNMILQPSVAPANRPDYDTTADDGLSALEVGAEMCSLDCGISIIPSKIPGQQLKTIMWTRPWLVKAAKLIKEKGIKPELEIFNHSHLEDAIELLVKPGLVGPPPSFTFVMNMNKVNQGSIEYSMENLTHMVRKLPPSALFGAMAIGPAQHPCTMASLLLGGNVRVGFEDNIYYRRGELAKSNAQLVERIVRVARDLGYDIATPDEAREILGIVKK